MIDILRHKATPPADLVGIIQYVRARWRAKLAVRGAVQVIAISIAVFFAPHTGCSGAVQPDVDCRSRLFLVGALAASVYFFLVKPLRRRVTDDQVALYLEEKEPSLQTMLVSAVESEPHGPGVGIDSLVASSSSRRSRSAVRSRTSVVQERSDPQQRAIFAAVGPARCCWSRWGRHSSVTRCRRCCSSRAGRSGRAHKIAVTPGNVGAEGRRSDGEGHPQRIHRDDVRMVRRDPTSTSFERQPLVRQEGGGYEGILLASRVRRSISSRPRVCVRPPSR
jgi:hypothetical protein